MNYTRNLKIVKLLNEYMGEYYVLQVCAHHYNKLFGGPTKFNPDVTKTIIKYLEPKQLSNFFNNFLVDKHMKFSYRAHNYPLSILEINYIFHTTPNITIQSLSISDPWCSSDESLIIPLHGLTHCSIQGGHRCDKFFRTRLIEVLQQYHTIKFFHICEATSDDMENLQKYPNLQILVLEVYSDSYGIKFNKLKHNPKLHTLKITSSEMTIRNTMIKDLSDCHNLECLELNCTIQKTNDILLCPKLHTFTHINFENDDHHNDDNILFLNFLRGCTNLHHITINSNNLRAATIDVLRNHNVRTLDLSNCHELTSIEVLKTCNELKKLNISNCYSLQLDKYREQKYYGKTLIKILLSKLYS